MQKKKKKNDLGTYYYSGSDEIVNMVILRMRNKKTKKSVPSRR